MFMNGGRGREWIGTVMSYLNILSRNSPGVIEESDDKPHSGYSVSYTISGRGTSAKRS
jgi:hypothetical protein